MLSFLETALIAGGAVASLSFAASFIVRKAARRCGVMDVPDAGRHQHTQPTPQWGGVGIALALLCTLWVAFAFSPFFAAVLSTRELVGYSLAVFILLIVGMEDDRKSLTPTWLFIGVSCAIAIALLTGIRIESVSHPLGGALHLGKTVSLLVTGGWLLVVTGATKFADGVDGLVTGQVVIGALLIALLSSTNAFFQPGMVIFAAIVGGAFLGFLPANFPPAKHFLGEEGSTIAGFSLGILAVISGAKFAITLMALGIPLMDFILVMLRRVWHGQSPVKGDRTHLHHRLQDAGLSPRAVVAVIWVLSAGFGVAALQFQTQGKILLVTILFLLTLFLSEGAAWRARSFSHV